MSYVQSNLLDSEQVLLASRAHWIVFARSFLLTVISIGLWYYVPDILDSIHDQLATTKIPGLDNYNVPTYDRAGQHSMKALGIIAAFCGLWWFGAWLRYITTEYAVTTQRVIVKSGLILRNTNELSLTSTDSVQLHQTIPGRILRYGTLVAIGRGDNQDHLRTVPNPQHFRHVLHEQMAHIRSNEKAPVSDSAVAG